MLCSSTTLAGYHQPCPARPQRAQQACSGSRSFGATQQRSRSCRRRAPPAAAATNGPVGIIMECDTALVDAHGEGHRVAFNRAFEEVGHDCTNWTQAVFYDLMRLGDGTGEGIIAAYYGIRGWPVMLASSERPAFVKTVHNAKVRILREMAQKGEIPLRAGAAEFIDAALADGARIAVVAATQSVPEDGLVSSAMFNLGPNRAFQLKVVTMGAGGGGADEGEACSSSSSDEEADMPPGATFEQQVASAQARAKTQAAKEFVRVYNLQKASGMGMAVDPKMITAAERAGKLTPQFMGALAATLGSPLEDTIVVAGGNTIMEAGKSAGMLTLAVPPSVAQRGSFPAANAMFDGFGAGGGLTYHKAGLMLAKHKQAQQ